MRLPLTSGSVFGKYRLVAKLGEGGMAEVFLAIDRGFVGFDKLVVIKRLKPGSATDPEAQEMFVDEARIAARLHHPNVVQTHECGCVEEQHYLAMEYLDGQPLDRMIYRIGYKDQLATYLTVLSEALSGLHHAHELADFDGTPLNVVHRDVSPHNIFVTYAGQVKVVDFGIAKWASRSAETSTGVVKGKIAYMAPEQALSAPADRRADLFSMGVILWEIAVGQRFWGSLSEVQILQKLASGELPRLEDFMSDVPEGLERICARALTASSEQRYTTAAEMRKDIDALISMLGQRPTCVEIGHGLAEAFADRRTEARKVIGEHLSRLNMAPEVEDVLPTLDDRAGPPSARGRSHREGMTGREATPTPAIAAPQRVVVSNRRRGVVLGSLIGLVAFGGLIAAVNSQEEPPVPTMVLQERPEPSTQGTTVQRVDVKLVELRITAIPSTAKIYLDDIAAPTNPFVVKFPKDGTGHWIRVEAERYTSDKRLVVFDQDVALDVSLRQTQEATAPPVRLQQGPSPQVLPTATNVAPAQSSATPTTTAIQAQGPKVDTSDPWGTGPR